jgi:hypothetical protein
MEQVIGVMLVIISIGLLTDKIPFCACGTIFDTVADERR